jgi:release factor glutamine methyltransferase
MTWQEAMKDVTLRFEETGVSEACTNAEYLAAHVLGVWYKSELRKYLDEPLANEQVSQYEKLASRRLKHEPLQHIIGETEFFGLRLFTSRAALIPRPETEILIEEVLKEAALFPKKDLQILDIGTGSGAIALALASKLPDAIIIGIDISKDAIALAEKNKERLKIKNVAFEVTDIFSGEIENRFSSSVDLLISNPPYIGIEEFETLEPEVRLFDPRIALTDEADGSRFYKRIAELAPELLNPRGKVFVEIGYNAIGKVEKIFSDAGLIVVGKIKDLQGIERVLKGVID